MIPKIFPKNLLLRGIQGRPVLSLCLAFVCLAGASAEPRRLDLYGLLEERSDSKDASKTRLTADRKTAPIQQRKSPAQVERFSATAIQNYKRALEFAKKASKKKRRARRGQKYLPAPASLLDARAAAALRFWIRSLGYPCPSSAASESALLRCLGSSLRNGRSVTRTNTHSNTIERLAIWQSSLLAKKWGLLRLQEALLSKNDYSADDPLNQRILTLYLERLEKSHSLRAADLVLRHAHLQSPMLDLWRGRILARLKNTDAAFSYFVRAARNTRAAWIERAILAEVRKNYPELLSKKEGGPPGNRLRQKERLRDLTVFAPQMKPGELAALKTSLAVSSILSTTNRLRLRHDGLFLIATKRTRSLQELARRGYTQLSQEPDILYDWARALSRKKESAQIRVLLRGFGHVLSRKRGLWVLYLDSLEKSSSRLTYFKELIKYLHKFPSDYDTQDRLIAFLLGENPDRYHWAARSYWRKAHEGLPRHTGSGRFIYWLARYFEHTQNRTGLARLREHFYSQAPGSFYAGAFWDERRKDRKAARLDFVRDWRRVKDRRSYLRWLSFHGGNDSAIRFLSHRRPIPYLDEAALRAERELRSTKYSVPQGLLWIYRFGHFRLGNETLRAFYPDDSDKQRFGRLSWIGQKSENLNYSVYYTRAFIRELGISEDPFGMPPWLLKTLYPRPYLSKVRRYGRQYGVQPEAVYAIMRQESMFREDAVSRSGARGLMQIMPRTGAWLASKMRIRVRDLSEPDVNIRMGAKFFSDLIRSTGDFRWAAIAYNGGPGNLRKWKRKYYKGDLYHFLEHLPRAEPRNYCRITYQNFMHYHTTYLLYP